MFLTSWNVSSTIHLGYLRTYISGIDQASCFHLTHISLSFAVISFSQFVCYLACKCLWISHLNSLSYHILVTLPSHFSSMEQMLMLALLDLWLSAFSWSLACSSRSTFQTLPTSSGDFVSLSMSHLHTMRHSTPCIVIVHVCSIQCDAPHRGFHNSLSEFKVQCAC